jgi:pimeloyl-ACP methyl ester carboxylesterase
VPEIEYDRRGSGEPLILIHSLGTDRHVWAPVLDALAAERNVVAVDLPGFGASRELSSDAPPSPARLAEAVARFARVLGLERPHVAGNSLGGWVALELAVAGHARSATAIAPAGLWPRPLGPRPSVARGAARAALPALSQLLASPRARELALAATMAHPERVSREDAVRLVRAYAQAPGYETVNAAMRSGRFEDLASIDVPVTLAWPDRDRLVGRPAQLPANVRNVVLHGCGHVPMWDDPEQVAAVLLAGSRSPLPV